MATRTQVIKYELNKDSIKFFDEVLNIELRRRPSDLGFTEQNEMMASPRRPLVPVSTIPNATQNCSNIFFYQDRFNVNRAYRVVNTTTNGTRSHMIQYAPMTGATVGTWVDINGINANPNAHTDYNFNVVRAPTNFSGVPSTLYPIATPSTIVDRVKKATGDTAGATAIGKILLMWSGVYRGVYATITGYDSGTTEYILSGSGAVTPFNVLDSYAIYDTVADTLQVYSDQVDDVYIDGITYRTDLVAIRNLSLRSALIIDTGEFVKQQIFFANRFWVFKNGTIFASSGQPLNPFFYSLARSYTITEKVITGMIIYRNRIVCYGKDFIYAVDQNFTIEKLSDYYGVVGNAIVTTGDDLYFVSTNGKIVSMNEASSGSLFIKNIADTASLYTKDFIDNTFAGSDDTRIYFGGRRTSGAFSSTADVLVYDLANKYWGIFVTPAISGITTLGGVAFFRDAILPCHRTFNFAGDYFSPTETVASTANLTAVSATASKSFIQKLSTRWIKGSSVFNSQKSLKDILLYIENVVADQLFRIKTYRMLDQRITLDADRIISLQQVNDMTTPTGLGGTGTETTGGVNLIGLDTQVPRLLKLTYKPDYANMIKFSIETEGDGAFYLNELQAIVTEETDNDWFNPTSVS